MRVLSGIQPSGTPHLGNYFGYLKQNIDLLGQGDIFLMIADLHALTTIDQPEQLRMYRQELVKDFLACGLDPKRGTLFFQSYIPEHAELSWILSCVTPMGLLERAVSYKEKVERGIEGNVGLFTYPVLQTADIVLYAADTVPVGKDQQQHIEIARDITEKFNRRFGKDILVVPQARIRDEVAIVPGIDGRKMSKSYGNAIAMFADEGVVRKAIMSIQTDSKNVDEPKDPSTSIIYQLHALFLSESERKTLAGRYRAGGLGYGDLKKELFTAFMDYFKPMRALRMHISDADAEAVIIDGSKYAREVAAKTMDVVRTAVGLR